MESASVKEWTSFHSFPGATQIALQGLLSKLREQNVGKMTILVLGRSGVGKSSLINSLFGEAVAAVSAFQLETLKPCLYSRSREGFQLSVIDTPGLDGSAGDEEVLLVIRRFLAGQALDLVLYVERLDEHHLHQKLIRAISSALGRQLWHRGILVLTHAQTHPEDVAYASLVSTRSAALQHAIVQETGVKTTVPFVLVENSASCCVNADHEKILPDGRVWYPLLFEALVDLITMGSHKSMIMDEEKSVGVKPMGNIWMPLALLAQFLFIWRPIRKAIERDLSKETRPSWDLQSRLGENKEVNS